MFLTGTGKGTTVDELLSRLPNAVSWSNGNIFRSLSLLAVTWYNQQQKKKERRDGKLPGQIPIKSNPSMSSPMNVKKHRTLSSGQLRRPEESAKSTSNQYIDREKNFRESTLTPSNLKLFMEMLEFGRFGESINMGGGYDVKINGLGFKNVVVSNVKNTLLKSAEVTARLTDVSRVAQGHVIKFAANSITTMVHEGGHCVVLEGREATVDYVPTPHRFRLTMSDTLMIGRRRAAQLIAAEAFVTYVPQREYHGGGDIDAGSLVAEEHILRALEKFTKDKVGSSF